MITRHLGPRRDPLPSWTSVGTAAADATSYTVDAGLTSISDYAFRVLADGAGGSSGGDGQDGSGDGRGDGDGGTGGEDGDDADADADATDTRAAASTPEAWGGGASSTGLGQLATFGGITANFSGLTHTNVAGDQMAEGDATVTVQVGNLPAHAAIIVGYGFDAIDADFDAFTVTAGGEEFAYTPGTDGSGRGVVWHTGKTTTLTFELSGADPDLKWSPIFSLSLESPKVTVSSHTITVGDTVEATVTAADHGLLDNTSTDPKPWPEELTLSAEFKPTRIVGASADVTIPAGIGEATTTFEGVKEGATKVVMADQSAGAKSPATTQVAKAAKITHRGDLWWFGGEDAVNYEEEITLTMDVPGTDFETITWEVTSGQGVVDLVNGPDTGDVVVVNEKFDWTVRLRATSGSSGADDVHVKLRLDGNEVATTKLTVRHPAHITNPAYVDVATPNGWDTTAVMKIQDQFGVTLPSPVEVNETFGAMWVTDADFPNEDWNHAAPDGSMTDPAKFEDFYGSDPNGIPAAVPPNHPNALKKIDHNTQAYYVGHTTPGRGIAVKGHTIQFYLGKARHT